MKRERGIFLIFFIMMSLLFSCSHIPQSKVTLPEEILIVPPAPNLPKEIIAFSGKWEGTWDNIMDAILIVEEINSEKALIIYAWADAPQWDSKGGYSRHIAKVILGPKPRIEFGSGDRPKFIYEMGQDLRTIKGRREYRDQYNIIVMKKSEK